MESAIHGSLALSEVERIVIFGSFYTIADASIIINKLR
jgi:dihydrofolate synthase/folylpolyglutamate synthase